MTGRNFGCGSSREGAVWAMLATGIRCIVARSFADIYRENCLQNGLLPVELKAADSAAFEARVLAADGAAPFTVDLLGADHQRPGRRRSRLRAAAAPTACGCIEGLDDIGLTLKHAPDIAAWEKRMAGAHPWLQRATDSRR